MYVYSHLMSNGSDDDDTLNWWSGVSQFLDINKDGDIQDKVKKKKRQSHISRWYVRPINQNCCENGEFTSLDLPMWFLPFLSLMTCPLSLLKTTALTFMWVLDLVYVSR